jgi:putative ABC transport system permease protein
MTDLLADVRYALRSLIKNPGFAAVAVLTLALGIGANSAIFSVVNAVVLRPLAYDEPAELVAIATQFPTLGFDEFWVSPPEYLELKERNRVFESIGGYRSGQSSVGGMERPVRVTSATATADLFTTLGVPARMGRTYTAEEDLPNAEPVVVVSHELWQTALGADPAIIGRTIEVNGQQRQVVGVMPPGFDVQDEGIQLYLPSGIDPAQRTNGRGSHFLNLIGRLRQGATMAAANGDIERMLAEWTTLNPGTHVPGPDNHRVIIEPLQDDLVGSVRPALLLLLGAVGFVLLIACANVGNLLLARAESRGREIAVRTALGAGSGRLLRQFVTESVVLALIGGAAGLVLGWVGVRTLLAVSPDSIPRSSEIGIDGAVLVFTLAVSLVTGLLFGLAPALHVSPRHVNRALREGGHRTTASAGRQHLRRLLVVSEVALAVVLVIGSGLMLRSFAALQRVDPGFDAENILTFGLFLPPATYPDAQSQTSFYDRLLSQLRTAPSVSAVAAMSGLPPRRDVNANDMEIEGFQPTEDGPAQNVDYWQFVTTDYLETMRIPLIAGRGFTIADVDSAAPEAVINETLARVFYPDVDPIGRRLRPGFGSPPWFTIVGIAKDVKQGGLEESTGTEMYVHMPQSGAAVGFVPRQMNVVVRTAGDPMLLANAARAAVAQLDPSLPVSELRPMDEVLSTSVARPRFLALLLFTFAAVALTLAAVGTYGVMAYSVAERRQEIGIRMALGAQGAMVLRMVLAQGALVAGVGALIGVGGAYALTQYMQSLLFGISPTDVMTFLAAPAVLAAVALVACFIPAWRATRVDPVRVLRQE